MTVGDIVKAAKERLAGNTGFNSPRVVGINLENGLRV